MATSEEATLEVAATSEEGKHPAATEEQDVAPGVPAPGAAAVFFLEVFAFKGGVPLLIRIHVRSSIFCLWAQTMAPYPLHFLFLAEDVVRRSLASFKFATHEPLRLSLQQLAPNPRFARVSC